MPYKSEGNQITCDIGRGCRCGRGERTGSPSPGLVGETRYDYSHG